MAFKESGSFTLSDETFNFRCTKCGRKKKRVEAVNGCNECSEYYCQACTDDHQTFFGVGTHNLLDVTSNNQATGQQRQNIEFPTEKCKKHPGKVINMFCVKHDVAVCSDCFLDNHRYVFLHLIEYQISRILPSRCSMKSET